MNYRSLTDMNNAILRKLHIIPRDIDLVVGIPRSGMLPANLLALYLNKPYTDIHSFLNGHIYQTGERGKFIQPHDYRSILVVDDSIASGSALAKVKDLLRLHTDRYHFKYGVVFMAPGKESKVDYFFETVALPRYFQWNLFNHTGLQKACFDIDGVLCADPSEAQNDDGPQYRDFILNAPPLYTPGSRIGTIVTSRLEKYRTETEQWLAANNIVYNDLVMLDLPNKEARQRAGSHAQHKANTYAGSGYTLFIESDLSQAREINRLTGKPVFCTENFSMIHESQSVVYNLKSGRYLPFLRKVALYLRGVYRKFRSRNTQIKMA